MIAFGLLSVVSAQAPATVRQLMLDLIHPASNEILLFVNRGGSSAEKDWTSVRRSALTLAESANLLAMPGRTRDGEWLKQAKALADLGAAAYQAAQDRDIGALSRLAEPLDASCTACHQRYRPNVFPRQGGSK